jgi:signal transduction histidine kinase
LNTFRTVGNQIGQFIARREAEEALRVAKELAEAANLAKTEFLATISHELRTPLTSIRGFLQTLLADREVPAAARVEFLTLAHEQSLRLSRLVSDLLELSSIEGGRGRFNEEMVDLAQLLQNCVAELAPLAQEKCQTVHCNLADQLPLFRGDTLRLQSVMTNLLGNALKFTPAGGHIRLGLQVLDGSICLEVSDDGPGIPADQEQLIFKRFHRVYRPGSSATGTGLGLPIVKAIVEHYRGNIKLQSRLGEGSTFRIYLPMHPALSSDQEAVGHERVVQEPSSLPTV